MDGLFYISREFGDYFMNKGSGVLNDQLNVNLAQREQTFLAAFR